MRTLEYFTERPELFAIMLGGLALGIAISLIIELIPAKRYTTKWGRRVGLTIGIIVIGLSFWYFPPLFVLFITECLHALTGGGILALLISIFVAIGLFALAWVIIHRPLRAKYKKYIKSNRVVQEVIKILKHQRFSAIVICYDGVRLFDGTAPILPPVQHVKCKTKEEYEKCQARFTSYKAVMAPQGNVLDISFAERGFKFIDIPDSNMFMEVICSEFSQYDSFAWQKCATYKELGGSYRVGSNYYVVNGNLNGGGSTISEPDQNYSKTLDYYNVAIRKDLRSNTNTQPVVQKYENW